MLDRLFYLDTNVLSSLAADAAAARCLRRQVQTLVTTGNCRILAGLDVVEEFALATEADRHVFTCAIDLLQRLVGDHLLKYSEQICAAEVRKGSRLSLAEASCTPNVCQALYKRTRTDRSDWLAEVRAEVEDQRQH